MHPTRSRHSHAAAATPQLPFRRRVQRAAVWHGNGRGTASEHNGQAMAPAAASLPGGGTEWGETITT